MQGRGTRWNSLPMGTPSQWSPTLIVLIYTVNLGLKLTGSCIKSSEGTEEVVLPVEGYGMVGHGCPDVDFFYRCYSSDCRYGWCFEKLGGRWADFTAGSCSDIRERRQDGRWLGFGIINSGNGDGRVGLGGVGYICHMPPEHCHTVYHYQTHQRSLSVIRASP